MDWSHLQRHVVELRQLADVSRAAAARAAATDGVAWRSVAAERFREALGDEALRTRRCADLLDDAARALAGHLRAVHASGDQGARP
jgi:hypothetical protein